MCEARLHTFLGNYYMKEKIKSFWETNPCGKRLIPFEEGTKEFFEAVDERRYRNEPFILEAVDFARHRGKKVLEIGCGLGSDFMKFVENGADAYAVDLTDKAVALTRKRMEVCGRRGGVSTDPDSRPYHQQRPLPDVPRFSWSERIKQADAEDLPFPDNTFDVVYSWGVLHHTPDTEKAVAEVFRVLKPGGEFIGMLYNKYSTVTFLVFLYFGILKGGLLRKSWREILSENTEGPGNILTKAYTKKEVENLLQDFRDVRIEPVLTVSIRLPKFINFFMKRVPRRFGWFYVIHARKPL